MTSKSMNIILANAPIKNGNRGCVALSISMLYLIDEILTKAGISYKVYLPDSNYLDGKAHEYKIGDKVIQFYDVYYPTGLTPKERVKLWTKNILKKNAIAKIFKNADFILDIGQGDSFTDIYGKQRFDLIDRIHKLARKYKKPYALLPQTIGPFSDEQIKKFAAQSIQNASLCLARDSQSCNYVKNNVPEQNAVLESIDVAFFMPYKKMSFETGKVHVGLNISSLMWNGGYNHQNQFGLMCDYKTVIRLIIDWFLGQPNVKLHLVSHVVLAERNVENDYEVAYDLWREYDNPNLVLAPFALGPIEIKDYIAGLDFFMGARMHATIGAFSSGVPVIPMAYSRKFEGLFVDTLKYPFVVDMKKKLDHEIFDYVVDKYKNRDVLKHSLECSETIINDKKNLICESLKNFFKLA